MTSIPFPPPRWTNQPLIVYHGTTDIAAAAILSNGVRVASGRSRTDFGPGFYTTTLERQARSWAWLLSNRVAGTRPAVLRFDIDRDQLAALQSIAFVRGDFDAEEYWSFLVHCRSGMNNHARAATPYYDVVFGPLAASWQQRAIIQDADQVSFHTQAAETVVNKSGGRLWP
ncbi:MAG TPA: DUF3990 domain-containing protein [Longimicrobium sp.]|jgi:hypothetical protein